ncbi:matrixin family metalloprotease [Paenibacillus sp. FSL R7-0204]|uniref:matrixin family metalloprotease n=1 Tax=Paenibacillus sp. FSL R7-0204 TaxID=2921675 RepID=UPI0030F5BF01
MKRIKFFKVFTIAVFSLVVTSTSASAAVTTDGRWYNNTNFKLSSILGSVSNYFATDAFVEGVQWDGVTYSTILDPSGTIIKAEVYLNTWAFTQRSYSAAQKAAVAAHELGHSLGLNEASVVESSSIMWPYSFNSSGQFVKVLNPSSTDISVVNSHYPAFALVSLL